MYLPGKKRTNSSPSNALIPCRYTTVSPPTDKPDTSVQPIVAPPMLTRKLVARQGIGPALRRRCLGHGG